MDRNPVKNFFLSKLFLIISILCVAIIGVADASFNGVADFERLRKVAEKGDAQAQFNIGLRYYSGKGVTKDIVEAARWFRKAAEQGNAFAQHSLGNCYSRGSGVAKDLDEADKWYRKAAEQGYIPQMQLQLLRKQLQRLRKEK